MIWIEEEVGSNIITDHSEGERNLPEDGTIWRWIVGRNYWKANQVREFTRLSGKAATTLTKTFTAKNLPHGIYDVKITRLTEETTDVRYGDTIYFSTLRQVYYDDFSYPRIALVGIKSLGTTNISGSLEFSCMLEGKKIRVYNSGTGLWSVVYSNNPAWVCYDILTQPVFNADETVNRYDAYNPANLDYIKFAEWADWCDVVVSGSKRITFNGVFDTEMTVWDAALKVCEVGRASLLWNGNIITVVVDKAGIETQLFTLGNIGVDSFKETFLGKEERAGEIEIDFINKDRDYERDQFTLVNTTLDKPNNKVSLQLMGCTSPDEAWRAAKYRLLCNQYLLRTIEFNVDVDAIACTVGDIVRVQHSVPQWGYGGRIITADANSVTIDQSVTIEAGKSYEILLRLSDDTIVEKVVTNSPGDTTVLTVSTPFSSVPVQFDLFTFGELDISYKPFRITGMTKNSDQQITISAIEYNANIYTGDTDSPVQPLIQYSALNPFVQISNLELSQEVYVDSSESLFVNIHATWDIGTNTIYRGARLYWREITYVTWWYTGLTTASYGPWTFESEFRAKRATFTKAMLGRTYEIGILGVNFSGVITPFTNIVTKKITIQNDPGFYSTFLKNKVFGLQLLDAPNEDEFTGSSVTIEWKHISAIDSTVGAGSEEMGAGYRGPNIWLKDYQIVVKSSVGAILNTFYTKENQFTYTYIQNVADGLNEVLTFEVKARSKLNDISEIAAKLSVTNTVPSSIVGLSASAIVGGASFTWTKNTEEDLQGYYVRTKVETGAFSVWTKIVDNKYTRILTPAEITSYTNRATITIEVQTIDLFDQVSTTETISVDANTISDNIFQLVPQLSGGTGTVSDLYNGNISSGGVVI
jgi:hypothetical protein